MIIQSLDGVVEYQINQTANDIGYIPASTFKIPNTLIALEEGVIKDHFETIKWDGIQQEYEPRNKDQTLKSTFSFSCGTGKDGWFVGYLETGEITWLFANHIVIRTQADLVLRKKLVLKAFTRLEIID